MITTEAWTLHQGHSDDSGLAELRRETFSFDDITDEEVLAEPVYGSWEANMSHALKRYPVDVCRLRREKRVVLGNAGVVRILKVGGAVTTLKEGDLCVLVPISQLDAHGYMLRVFGYDAPKTIGLLAKRLKLEARQVAPIPADTRHSLKQWAAYSIRYATAWDNRSIAHECFRLQMPEEEFPTPFVWGWGGGVALAELLLAKAHGCRVAMISSHDERLELIGRLGITPVDRRQFPDLQYDERKYESDHKYKARYLQAERKFLDIVGEQTNGEGVSIFVDNIGTPVLRATLKALGRQGVVTTTGWDKGGHASYSRIAECMNRHIHVHTHGVRYPQVLPSIQYSERTGWLPHISGTVYGWDDIPRLARDFTYGEVSTYFPIYEVNPL